MDEKNKELLVIYENAEGVIAIRLRNDVNAFFLLGIVDSLREDLLKDLHNDRSKSENADHLGDN